MDWTTLNDPSGFTLQHPIGWIVQNHPANAVLVMSPDRLSLALIQRLSEPLAGSPREILQFGRFPTAYFFAAGQPTAIDANQSGAAACYLDFRLPDGSPARAHLSCVAKGPGGTVFGHAAPLAVFQEIEPVLRKITDSFQPSSAAAPPVAEKPLDAGSPSAALEFQSFTDPQAGTFTVEVPRGWRIRGGFHHPNLGDRRPWVEAQSPDGIQVLYGDPDCPQSFCQVPMQMEGVAVPYPTGCVFVNLPPSAPKLCQFYLKNIAGRRFGGIQVASQRDRRDLLEAVQAKARRAGSPIAPSIQLTAHEVRFQAGGRSGSCLAASMCNTQFSIPGFMVSWDGNVTVWLAPPALAGVAEQVAARMIDTFQTTPRLIQIYQQDEAMIASNGASANMAQQQWFNAQQAGHRAQQAASDAIMDNYWKQQQVSAGIVQGWEQRNAVHDRAAQNYDDALMGRERLYDDSLGKSYDASSGSNFYWLDQQSGQIVGTNTDTPPDYQRNYTPLRKLGGS